MKINKFFFGLIKNNPTIQFYFEYIKSKYTIFSEKTKNLTDQDIDVLFKTVENFYKEKIENKFEENKIKLNILKLLILIKFLKSKISLVLYYAHFLNKYDIENYELITNALYYNTSILEYKLSTILWEPLNNFSFYYNFRKLFFYNKNIKILHLEGNLFTLLDLKNLTKTFSKKTSIDKLIINCSGLIKDSSFKIAFDKFKYNASIKKLIGNLNIYSDEIREFERIHLFVNFEMENGILIKINIYRNMLDPISINTLYNTFKINKMLKVIKLSFNNFPEIYFKTTIELIKENFLVEEFDLSFNNLDDLCIIHLCEYIKTNRRLKILNIKNNKINDEGIKMLSNVLIENKELKELDISWNDFGDEGLIYLENLINLNDTVENIFISGNKTTEKALNKLEEIVNKYAKKVFDWNS